MGQPGLFYCLLSVFSNKHYNFYNNICDKCPSSIRCQDLNPQPLGRESPPITTRPWLPPWHTYQLQVQCLIFWHSGIWETASPSRARTKAHGRYEVRLWRLWEKILHSGTFKNYYLWFFLKKYQIIFHGCRRTKTSNEW